MVLTGKGINHIARQVDGSSGKCRGSRLDLGLIDQSTDYIPCGIISIWYESEFWANLFAPRWCGSWLAKALGLRLQVFAAVREGPHISSHGRPCRN